MRKNSVILITVSIYLFLSISGLSAIELEGYTIHKKLLNISDAEPPQFIDEYILFTFKSEEPTSFVGAAFDFDNYTKVYQFRKTPDGIYFLVIDNPGIEAIKYRLIVDGLWIADPFNPDKIRDSGSVELSLLRLPVKPDSETTFPYTKNSVTHFYYKGDAGKSVFLSGSFNAWDPFMYQMEEKRPGEYYISLKLAPGRHNYYFVANGRVVPDRRNPNVVWDSDFREISTYLLQQ